MYKILIALLGVLSIPAIAFANTTEQIQNTADVILTTEDIGREEYQLASGDVNGDGMDDLAVVMSSRHVHIVYGGVHTDSSRLEEQSDVQFRPKDTYYDLGDGDIIQPVLKDINADGYADILFGVDNKKINGQSHAGTVYVHYGRKNLSGTILFEDMDARFVAESAEGNNQWGDLLGSSVEVLDFNKDGKMEIAIGAPGSNEFGYKTGSVYVFAGTTKKYSGATNAAQADWRYYGVENTAACDEDPEDCKVSGTRLGYSVSSGDVNADGIDDLVMYGSNPYLKKNTAGQTFVVLGKKNMPQGDLLITDAMHFSIKGTQPYQREGSASAVGDVNGDGKNDLLLSREYKAYSKKAVDVVFGPLKKKTVSKADVTIHHNEQYTGGFFGHALTAADVNSDGIDDLLATAHDSDISGEESGAQYIFSGGKTFPKKNSRAEQQYTKRIVGNAGDHIGTDIVAGDFNGDGFVDTAVSAVGSVVWNETATEIIDYTPAAIFITYGTPADVSSANVLSSGRVQIVQPDGTSVKVKLFKKSTAKNIALATYVDGDRSYVVAAKAGKRVAIASAAGTVVARKGYGKKLTKASLRLRNVNGKTRIVLSGKRKGKTIKKIFRFLPKKTRIKRVKRIRT